MEDRRPGKKPSEIVSTSDLQGFSLYRTVAGPKNPKASLRVRRRMKLLPEPPLLWKGEDGLTAPTHQLTPSGFV